MKKFEVLIGSEIAREVNANEYSVAPKTNGFTSADGHEAWTTSGKGKSTVNNHYIYFRHEGVLYYFKASADEVKAVREHFELTPAGLKQADPVIIQEGEQAPKARRRVKA